jgi:hypothetical protein
MPQRLRTRHSLQVVGASWDRAPNLSIAADICCDNAEIGMIAQFT